MGHCVSHMNGPVTIESQTHKMSAKEQNSALSSDEEDTNEETQEEDGEEKEGLTTGKVLSDLGVAFKKLWQDINQLEDDQEEEVSSLKNESLINGSVMDYSVYFRIYAVTINSWCGAVKLFY